MTAPLRFHWARLRATCHATEDPERVVQAMAFVAGVDPGEFAKTVQRSEVESHHGGSFLILEAKLDKSRDAKALLTRMLELPDAGTRVLAKLDTKVDDDGVLFVRAGKQAAYEGRLELVDNDDCVQLRFRVEAYPATRDAIVAALRDNLLRDA
jgi:RNA binding exosome subunit